MIGLCCTMYPFRYRLCVRHHTTLGLVACFGCELLSSGSCGSGIWVGVTGSVRQVLVWWVEFCTLVVRGVKLV